MDFSALLAVIIIALLHAIITTAEIVAQIIALTEHDTNCMLAIYFAPEG